MKRNNSKLYHSRKWREARKIFLINNWKCAFCNSTFNLEIDHILEHQENEKLFYNSFNWQTLCKSCHYVKTMEDKRIEALLNNSKQQKIQINVNNHDNDLKGFELLYTWKRHKELTTKIVNNIISKQNPNIPIYNLNIENLEFWKLKKLLDAFCVVLKEIPNILYNNKEFTMREFLLIYVSELNKFY